MSYRGGLGDRTALIRQVKLVRCQPIAPTRAVSSAVEHYLDMVVATGSIPVLPTICRCSSVVEQGFRKAKVGGSNPSIGTIGAWLSLVERLSGGQEAVGSNPAVPTNKYCMRMHEIITELTFGGSRCTKDCSGHRAGWTWAMRKRRQNCTSKSPSFTNGCRIAGQQQQQGNMTMPKIQP